ncbi:hypothetical protein MIR68_009782 [Amoeboaphelidium protococcarum]|nr:hypothetical protein MIR68_009782 [Amoeboaphelidium protococcarum]
MSSNISQSNSNNNNNNNKDYDLQQSAAKHHSALKDFLRSHLLKEQAGISSQRQSARDKLTRLNGSQFHELSTDVYDEMNRRLIPGNENGEKVQFLPVNDSFHQKRNQARQKLATLSMNRFKDLASDVFSELERRYPEVLEPQSANSYLGGGSDAAYKSDVSIATYSVSEVGSMGNNTNSTSKLQQPSTTQAASLESTPKKPDFAKQKSQDFNQTKTTPSNDSAVSKPKQAPSSEKKSAQGLKDVTGMVNFTSLDNLMADLGSMIDNPSPATDAVTSPSSNTVPIKSSSSSSQKVTSSPKVQQSSGQSSKEMVKQTSSLPLDVQTKPRLSSLNKEDDNYGDKSRQVDAKAAVAPSSSSDMVDSLRKEIKQMSTNLDKANAQLEEQKSARQKLEADQKELQQRNKDLITKLSVNTEELQKLEADITAYKQTIQEMDSSLSDAVQKQKDLEDQISTYQEQVKSLKAELLSKEKELKEHKDKVAAAKEQMAKKSVEHENLRSAIDTKDATLLSLSDEIEALNKQLSDYKKGKNSGASKKEQSEELLDALDLNNMSLFDHQGRFSTSVLIFFKMDLKNMLTYGKDKDAQGLAISARSIVTSCKAIMDVVQQSSKSDKELSTINNNINDHMNQLVSVSKNLVNDITKKFDVSSNYNALTSAAKNLVDSVRKAVSQLKVLVDGSDAHYKQQLPSANGEESYSEVVTPMSAASGNMNGGDGGNSNHMEKTMERVVKPSVSAKNVFTVEELRSYLEQQTDLIVQNIQVLLLAMKQSNFGAEFTESIDNIGTVVKSLTKESGATLNQHCHSAQQQKKGSDILDSLTMSNVKLNEMGVQMTQSATSTSEQQQQKSQQVKPSKQKLAAAAYEIAKHVKELVTLFESQD